MRAYRFCFLLVFLSLLSSCKSDWENGIPQRPGTGDSLTVEDTAIDFAATATGAHGQSRADGSIVNRLETWLPATDEATGNYGVGLFGYYTGQDTWDEWAKENGTPNFFYNQRLTVRAKDGTGNKLDYSPRRFWPNDGGRLSFWAYYPWNATGGEAFNIGLSAVDSNKGFGSITFTMKEDAAEQVDFMLSDFVADRQKSSYPLNQTGEGYEPSRVALNFHHMLAQVRLYAFVRALDRVVYKTNDDGTPYKAIQKDLDEAEKHDFDGEDKPAVMDEYGTWVELKIGDPVPDETQCDRWDRTDGVWDVTGKRQRANITYTMSFNNIHTSCIFTPMYSKGTTTFPYEDTGRLGSATVQHYVMNPYWFRWENGERVQVNETYMYGYFEDTPAYGDGTYAGGDDDNSGYTWNIYGDGGWNPMRYDLNSVAMRDGKHYNYNPGNIILAVPQKMDDNDVPHVVITARGKDIHGEDISATVTINLLGMGLKWESGFIYSYAFLENDLRPGDELVRGPESITAIFDPTRWADQW